MEHTERMLVLESKDGGPLQGNAWPLTRVDCDHCGKHAGYVTGFSPTDFYAFCSIACSQLAHRKKVDDVSIVDAVRIPPVSPAGAA